MTLSPPVSRTQQLSNSSPNTAALQAATLSFSRKATPPKHTQDNRYATKREFVNSRSSISSTHPGGRSNSGKDHLLVTQQSYPKDKVQELCPGDMSKRPLHSGPPHSANLAAIESRASPGNMDNLGETKREEDEVLAVRGIVTAQRRLLQESIALQRDSTVLRISTGQLCKAPQTLNKPSGPDTRGIDATSLEEIPSLKNLFENSVPTQPTAGRLTQSSPPVIRAPAQQIASLENPSLTAAILATQLSSPNSTQNMRRSSPILKSISTSAQGSPGLGSFASHLSSLGATPKVSLPPHDALRLSGPSISSMTSKESMSSTKSGHNNALLAATLAAKSKTSPSTRSKAQAPKPPPPRRAQTSLKAPFNDRVLDAQEDFDVASSSSATTGYLKYGIACSSIPSEFSRSLSRSSTSPAPPLPRRRLSISNISYQSPRDKSSAALTDAMLSTTSSTLSRSPAYSITPQYSLLPQNLTGDSILAASLPPSRITSPVPKKPPVPPAPRRRRRKSLPPPPKANLRETMREPPKSPHSDFSPQRLKPHLVKHHLHKHAEGERRRWRHFITEIERKRYEGLWAANKGLLLMAPSPDEKIPATPYPLQKTKIHGQHNSQQHIWSSTPNYTELLADCIDSFIVRDIWIRSRLPFDHLADIWDLVDRGGKGRLSRDEFIVGTWLIDQSLKGRKLPTGVQDETWQSVRRLGVKTQPTSQKSTHDGR